MSEPNIIVRIIINKPHSINSAKSLRTIPVIKSTDKTIERALPIIKEWEARGKPYLPGAAEPKDLPQAKIPAFPGAWGGGMYSFGGRGGFIVWPGRGAKRTVGGIPDGTSNTILFTEKYARCDLTRAPAWVRKLGNEWVHLLLRQPRKFQRYVVGNPKFLARITASRVGVERNVYMSQTIR